MRLSVFVLAAALSMGSGAALAAQQPTPASPATDRKPQELNVPVSLDRIREALAQPAPAEPLKGLNDPPPTFKVEINEQQKFDEFLAKVKFEKPGPQVAGGVDAYDQYQRIFPRIDNPRAQPYGAFTTGQILTLGVEALIEKYVASKLSNVMSPALRAQAEREARDEVARSLAQFWASQPSGSSTAAPPKE